MLLASVRRGQGHRRRAEARRRATPRDTQVLVEPPTTPVHHQDYRPTRSPHRAGSGRGCATSNRHTDTWMPTGQRGRGNHRGARGGQPYNYPDPRVTREGQRSSCGGRDPCHRSSEPHEESILENVVVDPQLRKSACIGCKIMHQILEQPAQKMRELMISSDERTIAHHRARARVPRVSQPREEETG